MTVSKPMLKQEVANSHCGVNHSARPGLVWYLIRYQHDKVLKICGWWKAHSARLYGHVSRNLLLCIPNTFFLKKKNIKSWKRCALLVKLKINKINPSHINGTRILRMYHEFKSAWRDKDIKARNCVHLLGCKSECRKEVMNECKEPWMHTHT